MCLQYKGIQVETTELRTLSKSRKGFPVVHNNDKRKLFRRMIPRFRFPSRSAENPAKVIGKLEQANHFNIVMHAVRAYVSLLYKSASY